MTAAIFAPGTRVLIRDAEWVVRRVDTTRTGKKALTVTGVSQLVKDQEALFLEELEQKIEILDPVDTKLVPDTSSGYRNALLYMESQLQAVTPTGEQIYIGHKAAMDPVPYQLDPALIALEKPRQRMLIADAVGLGKTLEAGILLSELIRRGMGRRILVVAVKSMLVQFQKEMWSRFTIPLTRLDSVGVKRIQAEIPTNHNPFAWYDKAIISMDTLKQKEYQVHLENAWWDVIVIDEAHNVATRGDRASQRATLSQLLAGRSDTLIMLSATPHDGSAESFASLMNMLDPTAIANPSDYTPEEIKGLYVRRFKKDIQNQVREAFQERTVDQILFPASPREEEAFRLLSQAVFTQLDRKAKAGQLFKTTLEKALLSSPAACAKTLENRIRRIEKKDDPVFEEDLHLLKELVRACNAIDAQHFAKYQRLLALIKKDMAWKPRDTTDRLVIFTERIDTLEWLHQNLTRDLKLKDKQVAILHGTMSDIDQNNVVEAFGQTHQPVRLLIASDVASEGINLHYLSHRMIHFDIPWSLMVFQQRNGRIDRYGQKRPPHIAYLVTQSQTPKIKSDMRILEVLIKKDQQAHANIGDPRTLTGVYDQDIEENRTARAMEQNQDAETFEADLSSKKLSPLELLLNQGAAPVNQQRGKGKPTAQTPSLYPSHFHFAQHALETLSPNDELQLETHPAQQRLEFQAPEDLLRRFRYFPKEVRPPDHRFQLSANPETIQDEIQRSRSDASAWPQVQYLWELHPVSQWILDRLSALWGRHEAPVLTLSQSFLNRGEDLFVVSAMIPNQKAQPLIHQWFAVSFIDHSFNYVQPFEKRAELLKMGRTSWPNTEPDVDLESLQDLLPDVVREVEREMSDLRQRFESGDRKAVQQHLDRLHDLKTRKLRVVRDKYGGIQQPEAIRKAREDKAVRAVEDTFQQFEDWIAATRVTEEQPYIKIIAVLRADER